MTDRWTDRLSEYLDGSLDTGERAGLEAHLAECRACSDTLADLRRVIARARALEATPPARDLWTGIAERIGTRTRPSRALAFTRRRISFTVPQLAAAAVALMLAGVGAVRLVSRPGDAPVPAATAPEAAWSPRLVPVATPGLDAAVAQLEQSLREGRGRLDTATVRVLEKNLAIIDRAIEEAHRALERDPASTYLNHHLTNQKLRKLELLRRANQLVALS
jgi:anti-sigma factor RsiW